ncbi:MAG: SRPBCC domain-containing protein [Acidimicrobiia bacterium]
MAAEPYRTTIEIAAPPSVIYPYLTELESIIRWMGQYGVIEARPGGEFTLDIAGLPVRGHYVELDPPRRVVIAWGHAGSDILPPGSSTVEITLQPRNGGTKLELEHRDLPNEELGRHIMGWTHYLERLTASGASNDPGPDPWLTVAPTLPG